MDGTPVKINEGKPMRLPPPATELSVPPSTAAINKMMALVSVREIIKWEPLARYYYTLCSIEYTTSAQVAHFSAPLRGSAAQGMNSGWGNSRFAAVAPTTIHSQSERRRREQ